VIEIGSFLYASEYKRRYLDTKGGDSCGISTSPRTPQCVVFANEEAEAVPAESVRLQ